MNNIENFKPIEIACSHCQYDGSDLKIGRKPISNPMMCSKCKRYFNPLNQLSEEFELNLCDRCCQMTNWKNGECCKCASKSPKAYINSYQQDKKENLGKLETYDENTVGCESNKTADNTLNKQEVKNDRL
jgi:hypothetical protein